MTWKYQSSVSDDWKYESSVSDNWKYESSEGVSIFPTTGVAVGLSGALYIYTGKTQTNDSLPTAGNFTVKVNGNARGTTLFVIQADTTKLIVTLSQAVLYSDTITITYDGSTWKYSDGTAVVNFTDMLVINQLTES